MECSSIIQRMQNRIDENFIILPSQQVIYWKTVSALIQICHQRSKAIYCNIKTYA